MDNGTVLRSKFWYGPRIALLAALLLGFSLFALAEFSAHDYTKAYGVLTLGIILVFSVGLPNPPIAIEGERLIIKKRFLGTTVIPLGGIEQVSIRPTYSGWRIPDITRGLLISIGGKNISVLTNELRSQDRKTLCEFLTRNPKIAQGPVVQGLLRGEVMSQPDISATVSKPMKVVIRILLILLVLMVVLSIIGYILPKLVD